MPAGWVSDGHPLAAHGVATLCRSPPNPRVGKNTLTLTHTRRWQVVSGLVGSGISGVPASDPPRTATDADVLVLTSSAGTPTGLLAEVTGLVAAQRVLPLGGVGNKVLALLRGDADVALMHLKTSLWDSCATEAVRLRLRHSGRRSE